MAIIKSIKFPTTQLSQISRVQIQVPVFNYSKFTLPAQGAASSTALQDIYQRQVLRLHGEVIQVEAGTSGSLSIDEQQLFSSGQQSLRLDYFRNFILANNFFSVNIEDLSFVMAVDLFQSDAQKNSYEFEVIDLVVPLHGTITNPSAFSDGYLTLFMNKAAYADLIDLLNLGSFANLVLLYLYLALKKNENEFNIDKALFSRNLLAALTPVFDKTFASNAAAKIEELRNKIQSYDFNILFEFNLQQQETAGEKVINGTFTILSESTSHIPVTQLSFYHLSLEYQVNGIPQVRQFNWNLSGQESIANKAIPFSFQVNALSGLAHLRVKFFDNSILWHQEINLTTQNISPIDIRIPYSRVNTISGGTNGATGTLKKLRGQVITTRQENKKQLVNLTVLLQTQKAGETIWKISGAAQTDRQGNFSMPYPFGNFSKAQVILSIAPNSPSTVTIDPSRPEESIADDFIYLLINDITNASAAEDDCACHEGKQIRRLPDQEDLIDSADYSQDVGGSCVNLTVPNRTLREYEYNAIVRVSDPDVANYTLEKITSTSGDVVYRLRSSSSTISRDVVNLHNPIRWQESPDSGSNLSLYQAVTVATGHILYYKSVFKADGYSLGELLYSLPLAPGQKKQIVVFDAAHTLTGAETQSISQGESLAANLVNDRSITDQLSGTIGEALDGRSNASTAGISAGLGVGVSAGMVGGSLGVAGGYSNSNSSASQNSSRNISQFFGERLRQSIMQNAESYRQLNATVVTSVREGQQYAVETEVVANHNHCHSLTMMYFEVLKHYAIFQELSRVEECVFVPLLMTNFTTANIAKWKDVLAKNLLPINSSTYLQPYQLLKTGRQHPLLKAFDANDRIKTNYAQVDYPPAGSRYADEVMMSVQGTISLRTNLTRPKTRYDRIKSLPMVTQTVTSSEVDLEATYRRNALLAAIPFGFFGFGTETRTTSEEIVVVGKIFDQFMTLDANYATVSPAHCIRVKSFQPRSIFTLIGLTTITGDEFFENGANDKRLWVAYANLLGYTGERGVYNMLDYYFAGRLIAEWDDIFYKDIAPEVFNKITESIRFERLAFDVTRLNEYTGGERTMTLRLRANNTHIRRSDLPETIRISTNSLVRALQGGSISLIVDSVNLSYTTAHFEGPLFKGYVGDDLYDDVRLYIPLTTMDKRDPRKEDRLLVQQLMEHLNSNIEYYNKILWYNLDADRRFMLLDGFHIQVFNQEGLPIAYRSIASVVKNQLITIAGNSLVFPVAEGYRLSQSYIVEEVTEEGLSETETAALFSHYKPLTPLQPYRISVPTKGVFLEAVQGSCDACEKVMPNTSQDWDKFKVDEPTAVATVTPPTPTVTDWKAAFKDFAQPLVNIQNAPATPAPGAGLAGLNDLLGKSGVFNDITGLQGNQQNAIRTYLSNQENAKAFAEMAKSMATQQHNTTNSDAISNSIESAHASGAITDTERAELTRRHIEQQIDGGDISREEARTERERERPSLADAAIRAASDGRSVVAQRTDTDGNIESVNISSPASSEGNVRVEYEVSALRQSTSMTCWATAATMMMNWRNRDTAAVTDVLRYAGNHLSPPDAERYVSMYTNNQSMPAAQKEEFITSLGMVGEPPASYPLSQYIEWLRTYGPLWVTTDAASAGGVFSPHARILKKIEAPNANDFEHAQLTLNDPATGSTITQNFNEFIRAFEQMVLDNPESNLFIQVVHFRDRVPVSSTGGEGQVVSGTTPTTWMSGVPASMTGFGASMARMAQEEYEYWHANPDPNPIGRPGPRRMGSPYWERDSYIRPRLSQYWMSTFDADIHGVVVSTANAHDQLYADGQIDAETLPSGVDRTTQLNSEGIPPGQGYWSAAFICYVVNRAGISSNSVFPRSVRHVDFVARAVYNRHMRVINNPFWAYRINEYAPQIGDIIARSGRHLTYESVVNTTTWRVNRGESHSDIVFEFGRDPDRVAEGGLTIQGQRFMIVIGGNVELNRVQTDWNNTRQIWVNRVTAAQALNVSVGKRKIYLTESGLIDTGRQWEIFDDNVTASPSERVQFTGDAHEFFAIIKIRTSLSDTGPSI